MKTYYINYKVPLTPIMVENLLVTAFEGGCNYWMEVGDFHKDIEEVLSVPRDKSYGEFGAILLFKYPNAYISIFCSEVLSYLGDLTLDSIIKALEKDPDALSSLVDESYDADTADRIIQQALFGEVIFA